jgi:hypothetical protein
MMGSIEKNIIGQIHAEDMDLIQLTKRNSETPKQTAAAQGFSVKRRVKRFTLG